MVDNKVDRIDNPINNCIGDAYQCSNNYELYDDHINVSSDEGDNKEMRLMDHRHKKHITRRTSRRYGSRVPRFPALHCPGPVEKGQNNLQIW